MYNGIHTAFDVLKEFLIGGAELEPKYGIPRLPAAPFNDPVYLRFNDLPQSGKSRNYATGETENGVSCYALTWDLILGSYKRIGAGLDGAMIAYAIQGVPIYFVTGEECGTGSDGEPLLSNTVILSRAKYDKEREGYVVI